jgi:hypothetical protein
MEAVMSKYVLGSRARVVDRRTIRENVFITLSHGGLVLVRATSLLIVMGVAWYYGLLLTSEAGRLAQ